MSEVRQVRWVILIVLQAVTVAWAYTAITHLLSSSPTQQQQRAQYTSTSQPQSPAMTRMQQDQLQWGRQSLFSVAFCFLVLMFVMMNWVLDGRPPRSNLLR